MPVSSCGNNIHLVRDVGPRAGANRVVLRFENQQQGQLMTCSCGFPVRYQMPCRRVLAVSRGENKMKAAIGHIHCGYRFQVYRQLYSDPAFCVMPPVSSVLDADLTLLPPAPVDGHAGRLKKGMPVRKSKQSNGEHNSSSKHNMPMSAAYSPRVKSWGLTSIQPAVAPSVSNQPCGVSLLEEYATYRRMYFGCQC